MSRDIQVIKDSVSLLDVVREHVPDLRQRTPGDYWGCCPLHAEQTPSFHVRISEDRFKCFGCGATGDVIEFVRLQRGLGVGEAIQQLEARAASAPHPRPPVRFRGRAVTRSSASLPPADEVHGLLRASTLVQDDEDVAAYLQGRGISPTAADLRISLARALPVDATCPSWAGKRENGSAASWSRLGYRLLIPLFQAGHREPASVRARRIVPGDPKGVAATGHTTRNLVMADQMGRHLLAHERVPDDWPPGERLTVGIAEGEIDFLTLATWWPDEHPSPAVFGVVSGSWTAQIAACIPDRSIVEIRTDPDEAGDRMARDIHGTLGRRCDVQRIRPPAVSS